MIFINGIWNLADNPNCSNVSFFSVKNSLALILASKVTSMNEHVNEYRHVIMHTYL